MVSQEFLLIKVNLEIINFNFFANNSFDLLKKCDFEGNKLNLNHILYIIINLRRIPTSINYMHIIKPHAHFFYLDVAGSLWTKLLLTG